MCHDGVVDREGNWDTWRRPAADAVLQLRVDREGHFEDVLEGRLFELALLDARRRSHAGEVVAVNGFGHLLQAALEVLPVGRAFVRGLEHQIHGGVEGAAGLGDMVRLIKPLPLLKRLLGAHH
jgi:hypothetical protein